MDVFVKRIWPNKFGSATSKESGSLRNADISARRVHMIDRIEWTAALLSKYVVRYQTRLAHWLPLESGIAQQHAFPEVDAEIEYDVQPEQVAHPRRSEFVIGGQHGILLQARHQQIRKGRIPDGNRHDAGVVEIEINAEFRQKATQCLQPARPLREEKLPVFDGSFSRRILIHIPFRRLVRRIADQSGRNLASLPTDATTKPAKHSMSSGRGTR
jgi:hypothetical protein